MYGGNGGQYSYPGYPARRGVSNSSSPQYQTEGESVRTYTGANTEHRETVAPHHVVNPMWTNAGATLSPSIPAAWNSGQYALRRGPTLDDPNQQTPSLFHPSRDLEIPTRTTTKSSQFVRRLDSTNQALSQTSHVPQSYLGTTTDFPAEHTSFGGNGLAIRAPFYFSGDTPELHSQMPTLTEVSSIPSQRIAMYSATQYPYSHHLQSMRDSSHLSAEAPNDWDQNSTGSIRISSSRQPSTNDSNESQTTRPSDDATLRLSCTDCDNVFKGNWAYRNRSRHMETKHAHVVLSCPICVKSFNRKDALLKHERDRHPELNRSPAVPRRRFDESHQGNMSTSTVDAE